MCNKFLLTTAIISSAVAVSLLVYVLFLQKNKGVYSEEYQMYVEPAQNYIERITARNYSSVAVDDLNQLAFLYEELAVLYEMYLADFRNEPDASRLLYETMVDFYNSIGEDIPQLTFEYVFSLLKKGVEHSPDEYVSINKTSFNLCCDFISDIYNEGKYVPRDTCLANFYQQLSLE